MSKHLRYGALATVAVVGLGAGIASAATTSSGAGTVSDYTPVSATRVLDTRTTVGGHDGVVASDAAAIFTIPNLPAGATAVTLNVTETAATGGGYLIAYPGGTTPPAQGSNLNFSTGQTLANEVTVPLGADDQVSLKNVSGGTVQLVVDLEGYYTPTAAAYTPPTTTVTTLGGVTSVPTGGSFNSRAVLVGTVDLAAGSYAVTLSAKETPIAQTSATVEVFPSVHLYNQVKNADFTGDVLDTGGNALESGTVTNADLYSSNNGVVTVTQATTMDVYAFGYDSDSGEGTYQLDGVTITATPVNLASQ